VYTPFSPPLWDGQEAGAPDVEVVGAGAVVVSAVVASCVVVADVEAGAVGTGPACCAPVPPQAAARRAIGRRRARYLGISATKVGSR
jgi:hypothetical protein